MKADDIIGILDPDLFKCFKCGKWVRIDQMDRLIISQMVCKSCWKKYDSGRCNKHYRSI